MMDRYAVIGNPVEHSKSPLIHHMFAEQTSQQLEYGRVLAPLDAFVETVHAMQTQGYKGANVTVPFKMQAYQLATQLTERAHDAGAVNTLMFQGDHIIGDNTDGAGLVQDIQHNLGIPLQGKRVLLIGAGGAAEGVLHPMLAQQPALLIVANRTLDKALAMVRKVEAQGEMLYVSVQALAFEDLPGQAFDVVVNATSAGLTDSHLPLPPTMFAAGSLAYDMMYGRETPFMAFARAHGAAYVVDGLGMLIEQAAESFYLWRKVRPNTASVIAHFKS
jgi:shikimate dehydrogenase